MTPEDDSGSDIPDDAVLWRRIPPIHVVGDRPSSAAFDPHPDDGMTSVCVEAIARTVDAIMAGHEGFSLVAFTAGEARALGFDVRLTDGDYAGHADLAWSRTPSARKRAQKGLAKLCAGRWVIKA